MKQARMYPEDANAETPDGLSLEEGLRSIPSPPGLVERLHAVAETRDPELDARLICVEAPPALLARLRDVADESDLDAALRQVAVPLGLLHRLRRLAEPEFAPVQRMAGAWRGWAFVVAAAASYLLAMLSLAYSIYLDTGDAEQPLVVQAIRAEAAEPPTLVEVDVVAPQVVDEAEGPGRPWAPAFDIELREPLPLPLLDGEFVDARRFDRLTDPAGWTWSSRWGRDLLFESARDSRFEVVQAEQLESSGFHPPLAAGYDRGFLLREHAQPIVDLTRHRDLAMLTPPLATSSAGFPPALEAALRGDDLISGAAPARVEDFVQAHLLAAETPRAGEIRLTLEAAPVLFRSAGGRPPGGTQTLEPPYLLHWQTLVGPLPREAAAPTHLVLALDRSTGMRGARLAATLAALERLIDDLGADDRVSIVAMGEESQLLLDRVDRDELTSATPELMRLVAGGALDLERGIDRAVAQGLQHQPQYERTCLVLIADGQIGLSYDQTVSIRRTLSRLSRDRIDAAVLDWSGAPRGSPLLARFASLAEAPVTRVRGVQTAHWALLQALVDRTNIAALDAELTLQFNPEAVAGYRLVGHEPTLLLRPAPSETTLRFGQHSGGLAEFWLRESSDRFVAEAVLEWRDPNSGDLRRIEKRLHRGDLGATARGASSSWLAAAISARWAETLRRSPYVNVGRRPWSALIVQAERLARREREQPQAAALLAALRAFAAQMQR